MSCASWPGEGGRLSQSGVRPLSLSAALAVALLASACAAESGPAQGKDEAGAKNGAAQAAPPPAVQASANASAPAPAARQGSISATAEPAPRSPQRAAIVDAVRPTIERKLAGPVEFTLRKIAVADGWAHFVADPQRPGGGRINPKRHFPNEVIEFMDGLTVHAILRFGDGGWTMVDHAIGPTDAWQCGVEGPPRTLTGC